MSGRSIDVPDARLAVCDPGETPQELAALMSDVLAPLGSCH